MNKPAKLFSKGSALNMAEKKGSHSKKKNSSGSGSNLATNRRIRETPYQDINRIRRNILAVKETKGSLSFEDYFKDPSFASDMTSLAYVYSGDDKYEKAVFKRPHEFEKEPVFIGVGGVCDEPFPWRHWKQRQWLHAALVTVSLSVRHLEKIIPGYKNFEQGFNTDYTGAFHFSVWRFGEWVDIVVDDRLPLLEDRHLFCGPMGSAKELWGPLVEKSYAKCKKTYQSIEYGNTLDAMTDLTGAVCEHFTPDVRPPRNLFRILVKSHMARSQMVCWRNEKRLTRNGFNADNEEQESGNQRYLHVVTAVTKFPTTDGRLLEMLRLKCPFPNEPQWQGRFSDRDFSSWESVNRDFMHRFQPVTKKDEDEYWMSMEDFRCNFGGLFIISSTEPFRADGLSLARSYHLQDGWDYHSSFLTGEILPTANSNNNNNHNNHNNNRFFRRSSTPRPEDTEEGLLDSDALELARRRTSHASIFSSSHSGHFQPFRHHLHHHRQRAAMKGQKQMFPNEEEGGKDTQSLFIKTNTLQRANTSQGFVPLGEATHSVVDQSGKKGFFSRSAHQHQHHEPQKTTRRKGSDLQRLAFAQNEAKRAGMSLKNALQTGFANVKLTLDCNIDQDSDAYESSTDESPDVSGDSKTLAGDTQPPKLPKARPRDQAKLTPCLQAIVKSSPCRRISASGSSPSATAADRSKAVKSPKRAVKSLKSPPTSPSSRVTRKSPKPLPRSPKQPLRSPKFPARSPKPSPRASKPSANDRNASTPSPSLVRKMTSSTSVATVIGNVSPKVPQKQRPLRSPKPAARGRGSNAASSKSLEASCLTPPQFKPPKSPIPHGHRQHRAVSPSPQRAISPELSSPENLKTPEIFSVSITRDKSSETLAVPGTSPSLRVAEELQFVVRMPEAGPPSSQADISALSTVDRHLESPEASGQTSLTLCSTSCDLPVSGPTATSSSSDQPDFPSLEHSMSSVLQSSSPKSPKPKSAVRTPTDSTPSSASSVPEEKISSLDDSFFQPVLQQNSLSSKIHTPPTESRSLTIPAEPSPQTVPVPIQPDPQAAYRRALRSVSSTSDTDSTHSSSDIFLHFKPGLASTTSGAGGTGGIDRAQVTGEGGGGGGGESIIEEIIDEGETEEKDKGFLLPVSTVDGRRPHSAPQCNIARHVSSSSLSSLTQGHFRATKADYFRSEGRWRLLLEVYDKWTRAKQSACRTNLELHSRSQRHHFHVTRLENPDELSPPTLQGKRHVIVSLLQDYRHGAVTANSLLVPIGVCVYKCKGAERDDKRHISRFQLIDQVHGEPEIREVTARFDLDPGYYFLVPFYRSEGHMGEYLLRVLTEDCPHTKAGCRVS